MTPAIATRETPWTATDEQAVAILNNQLTEIRVPVDPQLDLFGANDQPFGPAGSIIWVRTRFAYAEVASLTEDGIWSRIFWPFYWPHPSRKKPEGGWRNADEMRRDESVIDLEVTGSSLDFETGEWIVYFKRLPVRKPPLIDAMTGKPKQEGGAI